MEERFGAGEDREEVHGVGKFVDWLVKDVSELCLCSSGDERNETYCISRPHRIV